MIVHTLFFLASIANSFSLKVLCCDVLSGSLALINHQTRVPLALAFIACYTFSSCHFLKFLITGAEYFKQIFAFF